jgi:hypothetical protein
LNFYFSIERKQAYNFRTSSGCLSFLLRSKLFSSSLCLFTSRLVPRCLVAVPSFVVCPVQLASSKDSHQLPRSCPQSSALQIHAQKKKTHPLKHHLSANISARYYLHGALAALDALQLLHGCNATLKRWLIGAVFACSLYY